MADTTGFRIPEQEDNILFSSATQVATGAVTQSPGFRIPDQEDELLFATATEVASGAITSSPGFLIPDQEDELKFAPITTPASNSNLSSSPGFRIHDGSIFVDVYKFLPAETTFLILTTPRFRTIIITRRSYEGDVNLAIGADSFDIGISGNDLDRDTTLQTAIMLSLFTDRRAAGTDLLPTPSDRRGWWPDPNAGSKLWLYERAKIDNDLLGALAQEAVDSLKWLVEDKIAMNVNALATKHDNTTVALRIRVTLPRRNMREYKFFYNVENQLLR